MCTSTLHRNLALEARTRSTVHTHTYTLASKQYDISPCPVISSHKPTGGPRGVRERVRGPGRVARHAGYRYVTVAAVCPHISSALAAAGDVLLPSARHLRSLQSPRLSSHSHTRPLGPLVRVVGNLRRPPKTCHSSSESRENGDSEYITRYAGKIRPF